MDPVIAAQVRLEQAVSRLEDAVSRGEGAAAGPSSQVTVASAELERLRDETAALQAARRAATERLDVAIDRLRGLIEN